MPTRRPDLMGADAKRTRTSSLCYPFTVIRVVTLKYCKSGVKSKGGSHGSKEGGVLFSCYDLFLEFCSNLVSEGHPTVYCLRVVLWGRARMATNRVLAGWPGRFNSVTVTDHGTHAKINTSITSVLALYSAQYCQGGPFVPE